MFKHKFTSQQQQFGLLLKKFENDLATGPWGSDVEHGGSL